MSNKKLIILGFDGLDFSLTGSFLAELPNLRKLSLDGCFEPLRSVFPPDSIPSWITAYTGADPSEHGILESVNYLAKGEDRLKVDLSAFAGKTFWDEVGKSGKRVCVINPFLAYPVWTVNGLMVNGPVFIDGEVQVSDPAWTQGIDVPVSLGGITDFPNRKNLGDFVAKTIHDTRQQAEFGLNVFCTQRPDLFFQTFLTTDRMQHFLWRYCDKDDPTWPGTNTFSNAIRDIYQEADTIVGKFLDKLSPDDTLLIISDHGHGMRCSHCFNLNEYLRRKGLLVSLGEGKKLSAKVVLEKMKNRVLKFMNDHDLEDYIRVVAKFVPNAKELKKGKNITDNSRNIAFASDFTGTNPFGGICINRDLAADYDALRQQIIDDLEDLEFGPDRAFLWLKKREDVYQGPYLDRFPDILFEMAPSLGVNWSLHTDLFTINPTHKKVSGGHRAEGVLLSNRKKHSDIPCSMVHLYPTVLRFFSIDVPERMKDRSVTFPGSQVHAEDSSS